MDLTPEERKRIYDEEKTRLEAQKQIQSEQAQERSRKKRNTWLIILGVLFALWAVGNVANHSSSQSGANSGSSATTASSQSSQSVARKHLIIRLTKYEYNDSAGWVEIEGTARNDGDASIFSPTIIGETYDANGTLLGQSETHPAGQFLSNMAPGTSAGFSMLVMVHGGKIKNGQVYTKDAPFDVIYPK